jgi:hypothetical protein
MGTASLTLPVPPRVGMAQECLCTPGLLPYRCSARCCLSPRGLVSHSPLTCTDAWLARRSTRSAVTQTFPFSGLCVRCRASTLHLAEPPLRKTVVPGGWIDLTREGFCYALKVGILSFSVVAQSLVNWPYGCGATLPRAGCHPALSERRGALVRQRPVATQAMRCLRATRQAHSEGAIARGVG